MQTSQASVDPMEVKVNKPNRAKKGYDFEDEVALHAVLSLKQRQYLVKELDYTNNQRKPGKFDDIVLVNDSDNGTKDYYLYQLKNQPKSFTWNDLTKPKGPYSLQDYFDSYVNIKKHVNQIGNGQIKFLVIATTANLESAAATQRNRNEHCHGKAIRVKSNRHSDSNNNKPEN